MPIGEPFLVLAKGKNSMKTLFTVLSVGLACFALSGKANAKFGIDTPITSCSQYATTAEYFMKARQANVPYYDTLKDFERTKQAVLTAYLWQIDMDGFNNAKDVLYDMGLYLESAYSSEVYDDPQDKDKAVMDFYNSALFDCGRTYPYS